jgi:hypothetical protein
VAAAVETHRVVTPDSIILSLGNSIFGEELKGDLAAAAVQADQLVAAASTHWAPFVIVGYES